MPRRDIRIAVNGGGGWNFGVDKGGRNRVRTSTEDLVDIVSRSLEGVTTTHEGEGGCHIMVDEEQHRNNGDSDKRRLLLGPDPSRYLLHLISSNYKDGRGAQG